MSGVHSEESRGPVWVSTGAVCREIAWNWFWSAFW
jgi:hypothetical protein